MCPDRLSLGMAVSATELDALLEQQSEIIKKIGKLLDIHIDWRYPSFHTDDYWVIVGRQIYWSDEPFDLETIKDVGPHFSSPIIHHRSVTADYTVVEIDLEQGGDLDVAVFANEKRCDDKEIAELLSDW